MNGGPDLKHVTCTSYVDLFKEPGYHICNCAASPLVCAASSGSVETVKLLIKNGAALNGTGNPHRWNALMISIIEHHFDVSLILVEHMMKTNDKGTPHLKLKITNFLPKVP